MCVCVWGGMYATFMYTYVWGVGMYATFIYTYTDGGHCRGYFM